MASLKSSTADKIIVDKTKKQSSSTRMISDVRKRIHLQDEPLAYERERMATYASNHYNARFALPLFVIIVSAVISNWIGGMAALYWGAFALLTYFYLITLCSRYLKTKVDIVEDDENAHILAWRNKFFVGQILVAFTWCIFGFYACDACGASNTYPIIQFSTVLVLQAVTMILSYGFGTSILTTSAPVTVMLAVRFALTYEPATIVMSGILVGSQILFFIIADRFRLSVLTDLEHRAEREDLIAELETAKAMSEEARHRAEEANLAKSRFLATMSHELRTPLNAILGFSEVMKGEVLGPVGNDTYKGYVGDIHTSGNHLLNVINEILDLSRIEAGRQDLQEEAIRLAHVVDDASHMVQLKATQKNVKITTKYEENMPMLWADEKAVRQITLNLLSNALKFTPTGGTITVIVGWTSTGGQYISIKDNGPGIPEDEIPIVLSSFGQGSIAIKSAEQGTGLGLPIVQAMMQMHDGRFELKSKLRVGTEVIASFPRSRVLEIMERAENTKSYPSKRNITSMRKAS